MHGHACGASFVQSLFFFEIKGDLIPGYRSEGQNFHSGDLHLRAPEVRVAGSLEEVREPDHVIGEECQVKPHKASKTGKRNLFYEITTLAPYYKNILRLNNSTLEFKHSDWL